MAKVEITTAYNSEEKELVEFLLDEVYPKYIGCGKIEEIKETSEASLNLICRLIDLLVNKKLINEKDIDPLLGLEGMSDHIKLII